MNAAEASPAKYKGREEGWGQCARPRTGSPSADWAALQGRVCGTRGVGEGSEGWRIERTVSGKLLGV